MPNIKKLYLEDISLESDDLKRAVSDICPDAQILTLSPNATIAPLITDFVPSYHQMGIDVLLPFPPMVGFFPHYYMSEGVVSPPMQVIGPSMGYPVFYPGKFFYFPGPRFQ